MVAFASLALVAIADGVRLALGGYSAAGMNPAIWAPAVVVAAAILWKAPELWQRLGTPQRRVAMAAAVCATLVGATVGGYQLQQRFNVNRYRGIDPTVDWIIERADSGQRIGIAGLWTDQGISPVLPAFGPRLDNDVAYVGHFVNGMLRQYPDQRDFVAALHRGGYDYLVVGLGRPPQPEVREERWARVAGFEPVVRSERLALFRGPSASWRELSPGSRPRSAT